MQGKRWDKRLVCISSFYSFKITEFFIVTCVLPGLIIHLVLPCPDSVLSHGGSVIWDKKKINWKTNISNSNFRKENEKKIMAGCSQESPCRGSYKVENYLSPRKFSFQTSSV